MKIRYCHCTKPISQIRDGKTLPPSLYNKRTTCGDPECIRKQCIKTMGGNDYPTRYCRECNEPLSKFSKGGIPLTESKYNARKTCNKHKCRYSALNGHKTAQIITITLSPMDLFLGGKL